MTIKLKSISSKVTRGLTSRILRDRLTDIICVQDFGADWTGNNDCADAFDKAVLAAKNQALVNAYIGIGGLAVNCHAIGIVYVPRGKYTVSRKVLMTSSDQAGYGNAFCFMGESWASTVIVGNINDFILSSGYPSGLTGGFLVQGLSVINLNRTPFSSGCIYDAGEAGTVRFCYVNGMVGIALQGLTTWNAGCYSCILEGPSGPGIIANTLGLSQSTDASSVSSCYFTNWADAHLIGQDAAHVAGNVYEKNGRAQNVGGVVGTGQFFTTPASGFGSGTMAEASLLGGYFKSNKKNIDITGAAGALAIEGFHIDCTPDAAISVSGNVQDGISGRFSGWLQNGLVTGGPIDGFAYSFVDLAGGSDVLNMDLDGLQTDVAWAQRWSLPGAAGGGAAVLQEARMFCSENGEKRLTWKYGDLPIATLANAEIVGTTLFFSGYSTGLRLDNGLNRWIIGPNVVAGTNATKQGTQFGVNGIIDSGDGTGAPGNVFTFLGSPVGPAPVEGAALEIQGFVGCQSGAGYIDDGTGNLTTAGNVLTFTSIKTLTGATINNGAGGAGNILTISSPSDLNGNDVGSRIAIGINGAGGIPRDTWIIGRDDSTHWRLNRSLNIASTTMYCLPFLRSGYYFPSYNAPDTIGRLILPNGTSGLLLDTEVSLTRWTLSGGTLLWGPNSGPMLIGVPFPFGINRTLGSQINANQWNVSGAPMNAGPGPFWLPNSWEVSISQNTGTPATFKGYLDSPGNKYYVKDSPTPAWTGSVSNVGSVPGIGGGANHVLLRFDESKGYVIAG